MDESTSDRLIALLRGSHRPSDSEVAFVSRRLELPSVVDTIEYAAKAGFRATQDMVDDTGTEVAEPFRHISAGMIVVSGQQLIATGRVSPPEAGQRFLFRPMEQLRSFDFDRMDTKDKRSVFLRFQGVDVVKVTMSKDRLTGFTDYLEGRGVPNDRPDLSEGEFRTRQGRYVSIFDMLDGMD